MLKKAIHLLVVVSLALSSTATVFAQSGDTPADVSSLQLAAPVEGNIISSDLAGAQGRVQVVVRLSGAPAAQMIGGSNQRRQAAANTAQQDAVFAGIQAIDASATLLGRTRMALNAVIVEMEAAQLGALTSDLRIAAVNPVVNYELDLSETVPYIGATPAVQAQGSGGAGIKVAVLDSGIDYTHAAFGGAGTVAAYQAAYGTSTADPKNTTRDGLFPTARVVEGYDFVGEVWPNGALIPDEDPIDCGASGLVTPGLCAGGHGTHVADIIGGNGGVAPGVSLYAVKVCSAVSTSCSGTAILQGIDFAIDPDGNGDTSDRVHIINLSLGAPYGHNYDHPFSLSIQTATNAGTLTVASAGNSADKPYITGTPAGAREALSVAQTEVPSSRLQLAVLNSSAVSNVSIGAIFQPWAAPLAGAITAPVVYDTTNAGTRLGCSNATGANPWVGTPLAGKVVLVDRGSCSFSLKIANIAAAGGVVGVIALVDGSLPFTGAFGGGAQTIPGYMIRQADGNLIKAQITNGATLNFDPANRPSLTGTVVGSSSRGPAIGQSFYGNNVMYGQIIKPEIGAPGASVSAIAGSGVGVEAFGGTSGAAPMVAGSAALLRAAHPFLSPQEVKAVLMNNAETNIFNSPAIFGGGLAPISRIGGGEVRVDRAMAHKAAAWEQTNRWGALAFGFVDVTGTSTLQRTVVVRNYSNKSITYNIASGFRYADDAATGAVSVSAPASITVPKNSSGTFKVTLTIDGSKLRQWNLNLGSTGGDAATLTTFEYDGYLTLTSATANTINLPWHVIPRRAARVSGPTSLAVGGSASYSNAGSATAQVDAYALVGSNPFNQATGFFGVGNPVVTLKNVGVRTFGGVTGCPGNTFIWQFAVNAYQRTSTPQAAYQARINLDVNRDGVYDFQVRNADATLNNLTDGRNFAWVVNLRTGSANAFFFATHLANTANMVLTICGSQLADAGAGIAVPALGQLINARAASFDNYFTGLEMSFIEGMVLAPAGEKYAATIADIPAGGASNLSVSATGFGAGTSQTGVLLMLDGQRATGFNGNPDGREAIAVTVTP